MSEHSVDGESSCAHVLVVGAANHDVELRTLIQVVYVHETHKPYDFVRVLRNYCTPYGIAAGLHVVVIPCGVSVRVDVAECCSEILDESGIISPSVDDRDILAFKFS